jgi:hypothetical protein
MIACGWCGQPSKPGRCGNCHRDPALPWVQRGHDPEDIDPRDQQRRRLASAMRDLQADGHHVTVDALAERLDVSPRTVRRWQQMAG